MLAILTSSAGATHNPGNGPPFDFVKGSGQLPFVAPFGVFDVSIAVDGRSDGVNVSGDFSATIKGIINVQISGHLTCLRVDDHEAVISGVVEQTQCHRTSRVGCDRDGHRQRPREARSAGRHRAGASQGLPLTSCPRAFSAGVQLTSGDFIAHDGFAAPAG